MASSKTVSDYIVRTLSREQALDNGQIVSGAEAVSAWLFQQISKDSKYAMEAAKIILAYSEGIPKPDGKMNGHGGLPSGIRPTIIFSDSPDQVEIIKEEGADATADNP